MEYVLLILIAVLLVRWIVWRNTVQELRRRIQALERRLDPPPPIPETIASPEPAAAAKPSWTDRLRGLFGTREWEALIGVSLLNKAGALVFVIGLAFALSYSFEHTSAAGRVAISLACSFAVLGAGVWVERRQQYRVFARGLIGAGWAGAYATSYAAWAIPASRVIPSAFLGSLIMLAVAAGMIAHSLRYRAQAITAVAFFAAFAALAVAPSSFLAIISLVPLAAALLYLAARFEWHSMALFGLAATYLTCLSRGESGAPLIQTQTLFLVYWLLFEGFDLLRMRRSGPSALFPWNAAAVLSLSYLAWLHNSPNRLWLASAIGAACFLANAIARATLRPPSTFPEDTTLLTRLRAGSYEGPTVVAAILTALAILGRVPSVWTSAAIALEAELVYLAGLWLESAFLRNIGTAAFALSLARLFSVPAPRTRTPPLLFHAGLFYLNRGLRPPNALFSSAAAAAIAIVICAEIPNAFIGTALMIFGAILFEWGDRKPGIAALASGVIATSFFNWGHSADWRPLALSLALAYPFSLRHRTLAAGGAAATSLLAMLLLWATIPEPYLAPSWMLVALALVAPASLRPGSYAVALCAFTAALLNDVDPPRILASLPATALLYTAHFLTRSLIYSLLGTLLLSAVLYGKVSGGLLTVSWGLQGLVLLGVGFALRERPLRLQGLVLLMVCILKLFLYDMRNLETLYRILSFVALGLILICVSWIYSRFHEHVKKLL